MNPAAVTRYKIVCTETRGDEVLVSERHFVSANDHDAVVADMQARMDAMHKALDDLYSVQNGCPLPKYQQDWDAAMLAAGRLLGYPR